MIVPSLFSNICKCKYNNFYISFLPKTCYIRLVYKRIPTNPNYTINQKKAKKKNATALQKTPLINNNRTLPPPTSSVCMIYTIQTLKYCKARLNNNKIQPNPLLLYSSKWPLD